MSRWLCLSGAFVVWCWFRVLLLECCVWFGAGLLQGAAVQVAVVGWLCALWSSLAGAAAGCECRLLLSKGCLHLRILGAATAYCCLVAALCPDEDYVYAVAQKEGAWLLPTKKIYLSSMLG